MWEDESKPGWVKQMKEVDEDDIETLLSLLMDDSIVETLGECGKMLCCGGCMLRHGQTANSL